ncbi:MAG: TIM-barrel domain-containing protein [Bacteroidota bacterium]
MRKIKILIVFLLLSNTFLLAQNSQRTFKGFKESNSQIEVNTNDGKYILKLYNENIVETTFIPIGDSILIKSHAVVLEPKKLLLKPEVNDNTLIYNTKGIKVIIQKKPFQISYYYKNKLLLSEKNGYVKTDSTEIIDFNISSNEVLYGGGARVLGMNRRGNRLQLYNKAHYGYETHSELMNFTMPLVMSSNIYAVHFDNAPIGFLDLDSKKNNTLSYETIGGRKTYQVIAGDKWEDLMFQYTELTGKQPLPPRWTFGNFSSRFGYHSEKETRETVQKFIDLGIPLDAVIIDIYWFGADIKGHMGNLEFLKDSFPTPKKMINDFKDLGVKTILVTEPFILTTSKLWDEASKNNFLGKNSNGEPYSYDFYFGNTGIVDIYNPKAKNWFWSIYKKYIKMGISGWWGDLGEPEVHPSDLIHETGTADEVHNIYGHNWAELIYKGYQKDFPDQRPFILMRAGYSGSQQFGMIPWSGDVNRSWGGFQAQPEIALQMSMQGMSYMHSDLGGFAGGDKFDPELYIRWLQYGVFQPVFRPHAQEHIPSEPVFHDSKTLAIAKKAIELRYSLLPYNYTLAHNNNQTGMPFMRPLFFAEPKNKALFEVSNTYLWGSDFLISPILKSGTKHQKIYFPKNDNWIDFYTEEKFKGGSTQTISIHQEYIPVFVRSGAIIPMIKPIQSADLYTTKKFELHYYYDKYNTKDSFGELYNDDGKTPNSYKKKQYELLKFESKISNRMLNFTFKSNVGSNYKSFNKDVDLIIHRIDNNFKKVLVDNKPVKYHWDKNNKSLIIPIKWLKNKPVIVTVKL